MVKRTKITAAARDKSDIPSLKRRFGAIFYDSLLCAACLFVFAGIAVTLNQGNSMSSQQQPFFNLGLLGVVMAYFIGFWRQGGQTPGMKVWKIRLVADQPPAEVNKLMIRFAVILLSLGVAYIPAFFRQDKQGLHDILSKTSLRNYT